MLVGKGYFQIGLVPPFLLFKIDWSKRNFSYQVVVEDVAILLHVKVLSYFTQYINI